MSADERAAAAPSNEQPVLDQVVEDETAGPSESTPSPSTAAGDATSPATASTPRSPATNTEEDAAARPPESAPVPPPSNADKDAASPTAKLRSPALATNVEETVSAPKVQLPPLTPPANPSGTSVPAVSNDDDDAVDDDVDGCMASIQEPIPCARIALTVQVSLLDCIASRVCNGSIYVTINCTPYI